MYKEDKGKDEKENRRDKEIEEARTSKRKRAKTA